MKRRSSGDIARRLAALMLAAGLLAGGAACTTRQAPAELHPVGKQSSSAVAVTADGSMLLVANPDSDSLTLVDTASFEVIVEIGVGQDPRTVAVDASGRRAVTANRRARTLSLVDLEGKRQITDIPVGALPWGVVISADGGTAYAACEEEDQIAVVDLDKQAVVARIPVKERPNGLALSKDGETLYVTHLLTAEISVIDLSSRSVVDLIPTWVDGNLSQSIVLNPQGTRAYLPLTRSNTSNKRLTFDTTVFPLVSVVDLNLREHLPREIISLPEADQPVGLPYDAAFSPDGSRLYVVHAASDDLSVINLETGMGVAHLGVGRNPRGVVISPDGKWAFVNNTLDGTVSVIDARRNTLTTVIPVTEIPLPPAYLEGKRLFHSSRHPDLSRDGWMSCNSCHWEGEHDGRTWTFSFAGPRNTTSLLGMVTTYPLRWSAEWDESADSEFAITEEQFGTGLLGGEMHPPLGAANAGRSRELDSLALFIDSLVYLPNFHAGAYDPELMERGEKVFKDPRTGCLECHSGPYFTDFRVHDVGTADGPLEALGPEIDTPTLLGLSRSAPYLHNGSAATLLDVLTTANPEDRHGQTSQLTDRDLEALVEYMLSLTSP